MNPLWPLVLDSWDDEERDALCAHVNARRRITIGPECVAFEQEFEAFHEHRRLATTVNSGSSANLLAVAALTEKPETWIVPALGWSTTYAPLHQYGHKMIVLDVGTDFCLDYAALERHAPRAQGIMVVHPLGVCANMTRIMEIATRYGLKVIEDTCESLGARHNGQLAGTFGDVGTHSFYFSHHISTGEGGMVLARSPTLDSRIKSLRSHGWSRGLQVLHETPSALRYRPFEMVLPGYNVRMTDLQALVGRIQLRKLPSMLGVRCSNALQTLMLLCALDEVPILQTQSFFNGSFFAHAIVENRRPVEETLKRLDERGIEHRPLIMGNLLRHEVAKVYDLEVPEPLVRAENIHDRGFYIGNWPSPVTTQQLAALKDALQ